MRTRSGRPAEPADEELKKNHKKEKNHASTAQPLAPPTQATTHRTQIDM